MKSATLVIGGEARFPDAVTERGKKHLEELAAAEVARNGAGSDLRAALNTWVVLLIERKL